MQSSRETEKLKTGNAWRVVFAIALVVFVCSLCALGFMAFSYWQGRQTYDRIADLTVQDVEQNADVLHRSYDWDELARINPDIVGWIYVPDTPIDYPVVQGSDNEYYLTHDFNGDQGWLAQFGSIFLDCNNDRKFQDDANFIYGHHLDDGSMFAALADIRDQSQFEKRRVAYLYTPEQSLKLNAFSYIHCNADESIVETTFASEADMTAYVEGMMKRTSYGPEEVPDARDIDKIFALATCDDSVESSGRYVMFCYIEERIATD